MRPESKRSMRDLTADMSDKELTDMGRAMQKKGFSDVREFLHWCAMEKTRELLEVGTEVPCSEG